MSQVAKRVPRISEETQRRPVPPRTIPDAASAAPLPIAPGALISGKYRVEKVIGRGGMGVVAAAHDVALDRPVAIKFLSEQSTSNQEFYARFRREARAMAK